MTLVLFDRFLFSSTTIELVVKNNKELGSLIRNADKSCIVRHYTIYLLCTISFFISFSSIKLAYAHIIKKYGNLSVEVGWSNEPALVGELNNAIVQVNQTNGKNTQTPVINALANMNILAKYGGVTKPLDFVPSAQHGRII